MKFLIDAQLPPALAEWLRQAGYESQSVRDAGLRDAEDFMIWQYAQTHGWVILTKDVFDGEPKGKAEFSRVPPRSPLPAPPAL